MPPKSLSWPANNNFERAVKVDAGVTTNTDHQSNPLKRLNETSPGNVGGDSLTISSYEELLFIDINDFHISNDIFSIQLTIEFPADVPIDFTKARNICTFGYHIRGQNSGEITIGTDPSLGASNNIPVLGIIGKTPADTKKASPQPGAVAIQLGQTYTFKLVYNPLDTNFNKLNLFVNDTLNSTAEGLAKLYDFSVVNRKVLIGTSGWTNEPSWEGKMDMCPMVMYTAGFHSKEVVYPAAVLQSRESTKPTEIQMSFVNTDEFNGGPGKVHPYLSGKAGSKVRCSFKTRYPATDRHVVVTDRSFTTSFVCNQIGNVENTLIFEGTMPTGFALFPIDGIGSIDIHLDDFVTTVGEDILTPTHAVDNVAPTDVAVDFVSNADLKLTVRFRHIVDYDIITGGNVGFSKYKNASLLQGGDVNGTLPAGNGQPTGKPYYLTIFAVPRDSYDPETFDINTHDPTLIQTYEVNDALDIIEMVQLAYDITYKVFVFVKDHMDNVSNLFMVNGTENGVFLGDVDPPEIKLTSVTHTDAGAPGISVEGYAYDLRSSYDVYGLVVSHPILYDLNDLNQVDALQDVMLSNISYTHMLVSQSNTDSNQGAFQFIEGDSMFNYYDGSNFNAIKVEQDYRVYFMNKDSSQFASNVFVQYKNDLASPVDTLDINQTVTNITVSSDNSNVVVTDPNKALAKPNDTVSFVWTTLYEEPDDVTYELTVDTSNVITSFTPNGDRTQFTANFVVDNDNTSTGEMDYSLKRKSVGVTPVKNGKVFVQKDVAVSSENWEIEVQPNGSQNFHNYVYVKGTGINTFLKAYLPSSALLQNHDIYLGYPFTINITNGTENVTYDNVVYDKDTTSFTPALDSVKFENIVENVTYTFTVTVTTALGFEASVVGKNAVGDTLINTGIDLPVINLGTFTISDTGSMVINKTATVTTVFDKSSTITAYYAVFPAQKSIANMALFVGNKTPVLSNGANDTTHSLTSMDNITQYYIDTNINTPSTTLNADFDTYYLHVYVEDAVGNNALAISSPIVFDLDGNNFGTKNITSTNARNTDYLKKDDVVTFYWQTKYNSVASDFDVSIFNDNTIVASSEDSLNWAASNYVPNDWNSNTFVYDIVYADTYTVSFPTSKYVDVKEPVMDIALSNIDLTDGMSSSDTNITFVNMSDVLNQAENPLGSDYTGYRFEFLADHNTDGTFNTVVNDVYPPDGTYVDSLSQGKVYSVSVNVTDAAGNVYQSTPFGVQTYTGTLAAQALTLKEVKTAPTVGYNVEGYVYYEFAELNAYLIVSNQNSKYDNSVYDDLVATYPDVQLQSYDTATAFANQNAGSAVFNETVSFTQYYDGASFQDIKTENQYYAHLFVAPVGTNVWQIFTHILPKVAQTITPNVSSYVSDNSINDKLATASNVVTMDFTTDYYDTQDHFVVGLGVDDPENIVLNTADGLNWDIEYTVTPSTNEGPKNYSLKISDYAGAATVGTTPVIVQHGVYLSPFEIVKTETDLTIQGTSGQSFLKNVIDANNYTIREGAYPFTVDVWVTDGVQSETPVVIENVTYDQNTNTYSDPLSNLQNTYTFDDLTEGKQYTANVQITNVLLQEAVSSSNTVLNASNPTINNITVSASTTDQGDLAILAEATFLDVSSAFDVYVAIFDTAPSQNDLVTFYNDGKGMHLATNATPNSNVVVYEKIPYYYKSGDAYASNVPLSPAQSTYNVNFYCVDASANQLKTFENRPLELQFDDLVTNITLENIDNGINSSYGKLGDTIEMTWQTTFNVQVSSFDVTMMGQTVVPTVDGNNWTAQQAVPAEQADGLISFSIVFLDSSPNQVFDTSPDTITVDNEKPVFTYKINYDMVTATSVSFYDLVFSTSELYATHSGYTITFVLTKVADPGVVVTQAFDLDVNTTNATLFTITGLEVTEVYDVHAYVIDIAGNQSIDIAPTIHNRFNTADTLNPVFINTVIDEVDITTTLNSISMDNIKVYDAHTDFSLYAAAFDTSFDYTESNYMEYVHIIQSNLNLTNAVQSTDLSHTTPAHAASNPQSFLFTHYITAELNEAEISIGDYKLFHYAMDHEYRDGYDSNIQFGDVNPVNIVAPPAPTTGLDTFGVTNVTVAAPVESGSHVYFQSSEHTGICTNVTLQDIFVEDVTSFAGNSAVVFNSGAETNPIDGLTKFTIALSFTPTQLPGAGQTYPMIYQDANHHISFNENGNIVVKWGVTGSATTLSSAVNMNTSNDLAVSINTVDNKIKVYVNEKIYDSTPAYTTNTSTNSLVFANTSANGTNGFVGTINGFISWTERVLTTQELHQLFALRNKVLEYHFDEISTVSGGSNVFTNKHNDIDLPLHLYGDVEVSVEYPRIGTGALKLPTSAAYIQNVDISDALINGNHMTVMFWYYHENASTTANDLVTLSATNGEKLTLQIVNNGGSYHLGTNIFNYNNVQHQDVSQAITLTDNKWHHLAYVMKEGTICFYVDTVFKGNTLDMHSGEHTDFEDNIYFNTIKVGGGTNTADDTLLDHLVVYNASVTRNKIVVAFNDVLDNQMLLKYNFELFENSTTDIIYDESIHNNEGIYYNTDSLVTVTTNVPISQHAVDMDGITEYIEIESNSNLDGSKLQQSTVAAWVNINPASSETYYPILYKENIFRFGIDFSYNSGGISVYELGDGNVFVSNPAITNTTAIPTVDINTSQRSLVPADTATAQYLLDNGTANDQLANYDGTLSSQAPTSTNGIVPYLGSGVTNTALAFDGASNYVSLGTDILGDEEDELTLSAWVKVSTDDVATKMALFSREGAFTFGLDNGVPYLKLDTAPEPHNRVFGGTKMFSTGYNEYGDNMQTASASTIPIGNCTLLDDALATLPDHVVKLVVHTAHSALVVFEHETNGDVTVYGVGHNKYGQLGDGSTTHRTGALVESSVINTHLTNNNLTVNKWTSGWHGISYWASDGNVYSIGHGVKGQMMNGSITPTNFDAMVRATLIDNERTTNNATLINITRGGSYALLAFSNNSNGSVYLKSIGENTEGQLGTGDTADNLTTLVDVSLVNAKLNAGTHEFVDFAASFQTSYFKLKEISSGNVEWWFCGRNLDYEGATSHNTDVNNAIEKCTKLNAYIVAHPTDHLLLPDATSIGAIHFVRDNGGGNIEVYAMGVTSSGALGDGVNGTYLTEFTKVNQLSTDDTFWQSGDGAGYYPTYFIAYGYGVIVGAIPNEAVAVSFSTTEPTVNGIYMRGGGTVRTAAITALSHYYVFSIDTSTTVPSAYEVAQFVNDNLESVRNSLSTKTVNTVGTGSVYYHGSIAANTLHDIPTNFVLPSVFNGVSDTSGATVSVDGAYTTYLLTVNSGGSVEAMSSGNSVFGGTKMFSTGYFINGNNMQSGATNATTIPIGNCTLLDDALATLPQYVVKLIMPSNQSTLVLFEHETNGDVTVYGVGLNEYGQLGTGDQTTRNTLVASTVINTHLTDNNLTVDKWMAGVSGFSYWASDGNIYSIGYGFCGQMMNGSETTNNTSLVQATLIDTERTTNNATLINITRGGYHTLLAFRNNANNSIYLKSTGKNGNGQLGTGNITNSYTALVDVSLVNAKLNAGTHEFVDFAGSWKISYFKLREISSGNVEWWFCGMNTSYEAGTTHNTTVINAIEKCTKINAYIDANPTDHLLLPDSMSVGAIHFVRDNGGGNIEVHAMGHAGLGALGDGNEGTYLTEFTKVNQLSTDDTFWQSGDGAGYYPTYFVAYGYGVIVGAKEVNDSYTINKAITSKWVLVMRSTRGMPTSITTSDLNANEPLTASQYSRGYSLSQETGDFANYNIKTEYNGEETYLFRWVPFDSAVSDDNPPNDPSNATRYIQWTQTLNPTTTTEAAQGTTNVSNIRLEGLSDSYAFDGLAISDQGTGITWMDGARGVSQWWWSLGTYDATNLPNLPFCSGDPNYEFPQYTELYVLMGPKPTDLSALSYDTSTVSSSKTAISFSVGAPTNSGLTITGGTIDSAYSMPIKQYYVISIDTSVNTHSDNDVTAFIFDNIHSVVGTLTHDTVNEVGGGSVYYYESIIIPNITHNLAAITLVNAFNGITDTTGTAIAEGGVYTTYILTIDVNGHVFTDTQTLSVEEVHTNVTATLVSNDKGIDVSCSSGDYGVVLNQTLDMSVVDTVYEFDLQKVGNTASEDALGIVFSNSFDINVAWNLHTNAFRFKFLDDISGHSIYIYNGNNEWSFDDPSLSEATQININDGKMFPYWRVTVVAPTATSGSYNDLFVEIFQDAERTTRKMSSYASATSYKVNETSVAVDSSLPVKMLVFDNTNSGTTVFENLKVGPPNGGFAIQSLIPSPRAIQWRVTFDDAPINSTYMRCSEIGLFEDFSDVGEPPLAYDSLTGHASTQIYDGNTAQTNVGVSGPWSYTITFSEIRQIKQIIVGSTDGFPENSRLGFPNEYLKVEYYDTDTSTWETFMNENLRALPDVNGTVVTEGDGRLLVGWHGKDIFRWDGEKWYWAGAYGTVPYTSTYPKTNESITYY
jgi:alpha-tubulin suppressor-like RCC1 family protein